MEGQRVGQKEVGERGGGGRGRVWWVRKEGEQQRQMGQREIV